MPAEIVHDPLRLGLSFFPSECLHVFKLLTVFGFRRVMTCMYNSAMTRNTILEQIVRQFTVDGQTDFKAAFAAHPDWQRDLNWSNKRARDRCYAAASKIRRDLAKESADPRQPEVALPEPPKSLVKEQILDKIARGYCANGDAEINRAFQEHPEWLISWGFADTKFNTIKPIYSALRAYRVKHGLLQLRKKQSQENASEETAVAPAPDPIAFCPSCGFQLRLFHTAYAVALKHSRK